MTAGARLRSPFPDDTISAERPDDPRGTFALRQCAFAEAILDPMRPVPPGPRRS